MPLLTRAREGRPDGGGERPLELPQAGAERELARAQHVDHRTLLGLPQDRLGEREERRRGLAGARRQACVGGPGH